MIKIVYNKESGVIMLKGHTIPDICAAVSSVMYTTVNALTKYDKDCLVFVDNDIDDYVLITLRKHDNIIDLLINNMFDMFNDILEDGNEDKIEIL